jgi:hypothetical protein
MEGQIKRPEGKNRRGGEDALTGKKREGLDLSVPGLLIS